MIFDRQAHWERLYTTKAESELSWFQERPAVSLDLIRSLDLMPCASIIDIGAGMSRLADALLDEGFEAFTVLDISASAIAALKARLGPRAAKVTSIVADVTKWEPSATFDLWHDRATFHFLTEASDSAAYAKRSPRRCAGAAMSFSARSRPTDRNVAAVSPSFGMTPLPLARFLATILRSLRPAARIIGRPPERTKHSNSTVFAAQSELALGPPSPDRQHRPVRKARE